MDPTDGATLVVCRQILGMARECLGFAWVEGKKWGSKNISHFVIGSKGKNLDLGFALGMIWKDFDLVNMA